MTYTVLMLTDPLVRQTSCKESCLEIFHMNDYLQWEIQLSAEKKKLGLLTLGKASGNE